VSDVNLRFFFFFYDRGGILNVLVLFYWLALAFFDIANIRQYISDTLIDARFFCLCVFGVAETVAVSNIKYILAEKLCALSAFVSRIRSSICWPLSACVYIRYELLLLCSADASGR
jgi:hypothetical protein